MWGKRPGLWPQSALNWGHACMCKGMVSAMLSGRGGALREELFSCSPQNNPTRLWLLRAFDKGENEAQRGWVICVKSHSWWEALRAPRAEVGEGRVSATTSAWRTKVCTKAVLFIFREVYPIVCKLSFCGLLWDAEPQTYKSGEVSLNQSSGKILCKRFSPVRRMLCKSVYVSWKV